MNEAIVLEPGIPGTEPNIGITPVRPTIGIGPNIGGFEPGVIVNPDVPIAVSSQDPVVTGFSPDRGVADDWVRIFGSNFFSVTNIEFDGIGSNNFIVDANSGGTIVSAQVPPGATTGRITVVRRPVPGGILFRGTSINDFFVRARISRISPDPVQGGPPLPSPSGTTVTITGTGLGRDPTDRPKVRFNGALATEITALAPQRLPATSVSVTLPPDATDGPITLETRGGITSTRDPDVNLPDFNVVLPPVIERVEPNEGPIGTQIVITGKRFGVNGGNLRRISFEPVGARVDADITDKRNTNMKLFTTVPAGAVTGFIRVDRMKMGMEDPDGPGFSPTKFKVRANLEAPSNLTAVAMGTVINLSWMDNSGAELGFVIERKDPMNGYMEIGQVGANTATFQDSRQLARDVTYTYRVRAFDATGKSVASNEASARLAGAGMTTFTDFNPKSGAAGMWVNISGGNLDAVVGVQFSGPFGPQFALFSLVSPASLNATVPAGAISGPITLLTRDGGSVQSPAAFTVGMVTPSPGVEFTPNAPTNLSAVASGTGINLSWIDNSGVESGFRLERRIGLNGGYAVYANLAPNTTSFMDTAVTPGNSYFYRIVAFNQNGDSGYSNEAGAALQQVGGGGGAGAAPMAPSNLIAMGDFDAVKLSWNDNSMNEAGFRLERQFGRTGIWSEIAVLPPNARFYTDTPLSSATFYSYRIRSFNSAGASEYSNTASARPILGA